MKKNRECIMLLVILISVLVGNIDAVAMITGFSTEKMEIDEEKHFQANLGMHVTTKKPRENTIECFDINEDGWIALGSDDVMDSSKKTVSIYNQNGTFLYAYTFDDYGKFGIEWDGSNLIIYFVRSDVAAMFDINGVNVENRTIKNTIGNDTYWRHSVFSKKKSMGDKQYEMTNEMGFLNLFATSYSQLIETDAVGNTTVIYDVSDEYAIKMVIKFITVILVFVTVVFVIIRKLRKEQLHL